VRPPRARREKPRVSGFTSANIEKILALKPDLVLTFSDLQADIAADLIRHGIGSTPSTNAASPASST
jgi:iron complex transport system substrate-binding protein